MSRWVVLFRGWPCLILLGLLGLQALQTHADGVLRVGTAADAPPLTFRAEGAWVGIEADLARTLTTQMGLALDYRVIPRDELPRALAEGRIDVAMSGLVADEALEREVLLTRSWLEVGQTLMIRTDDVMRFSTPLRVLRPETRLGVVSGSRGAAVAATTPVQVVAFDSSAEALAALSGGRVDAVLDDARVSWLLATERDYRGLMSLPQTLSEEHLVWAVARDDVALLERLEDELQRMRRNGVLDHIFDRWIPVRVSQP